MIDELAIDVIDHDIRIAPAARDANGTIAFKLSEKCADGDVAVVERRVNGAGGVAVEERSELLQDAAFAMCGERGRRVIDRGRDGRRIAQRFDGDDSCLLYTSPSPRD